jgi:presenilin-like A22 family membrane protease
MVTLHKFDRVFLLTVCLIVLSLPSQSAHAYLDPGNSSFVFQIFIGFVLSSLFFIKLFWQKILSIFRRNTLVDTTIDVDNDNQL